MIYTAVVVLMAASIAVAGWLLFGWAAGVTLIVIAAVVVLWGLLTKE